MAAPGAVLITGGTGYLGQLLLRDFASQGWKVGYTYHSARDPATCEGDVQAFRVDLVSGEGLAESLQALGPLTAVINCAAVSQPVACEKVPEAARAINVPTKLIDALEVAGVAQQDGALPPLLIHLSTDQVYDGSRAHWREDDPTHPVNAYGASKLEAEAAIQARWPEHALLRSSIIYGPPPPLAPVGRALFLQFIDGVLADKKPTSFFQDEWRCPVYVCDIVRVCHALIEQRGRLQHRLFNMGGPDRLSRVDMAAAVAAARGHDPSSILAVPASSVARPVASPPDISMDSSRLQEELGLRLTPFAEALTEIFAVPGGGDGA